MDIAVFSDIHSNHVAFKTCIEYSLNRGIKHFLLLGDYISDCPYPQRTMELIYDLKEKYSCYIIRGNREEYMLDYRTNGETGWCYNSTSGSLLYTYENLTSHDLDYFAGLDNKGRLEIDGFPDLSFCHGSLNHSRELLFKDNENTIAMLQSMDTDLLVCGHTHIQGTFRYGGKKLVNPGSIGIPWYYNGKTQFAILHGNEKEWLDEYIQLDYDVNAVLRECKESGLEVIAPMWTLLSKEVLKTGNDLTSICLNRAMELCKEETGEVNWPHIPEKYWVQAVRENMNGGYYGSLEK